MAKATLKEYPTDPTALKGVKDYISQLVDSMLKIDSEKELQKNLFESAGEKYGVDKTWLKRQADLQYDDLYKEGKKAEAIKQQAEDLEAYEAIYNS